jgi:LmbE family N-acetylglucosaminyl deacetylase
LGATRVIVVISTHLDDAVLSAWSTLAGARDESSDLQVVTVYAGVPRTGLLTSLDRAHGAEESAAWLHRRRSDDAKVLGSLGCHPVHLDLLEAQFPAYEVPALREEIDRNPFRFLSTVMDSPAIATDPDELADVVLEQVPEGSVVYGPLGLGGHPDHRDLGRAMTRLAPRLPNLRLYADSPYYIWEALQRGHGRPGSADFLAWLQGLSPAVGSPARPWRPHLVRLADSELTAKLEAVRGYATEFPFIEADMADHGVDLDDLRYETVWAPA